MLHVVENQFWQALKLSLTQANVFISARLFSLIFYFRSFATFILQWLEAIKIKILQGKDFFSLTLTYQYTDVKSHFRSRIDDNIIAEESVYCQLLNNFLVIQIFDSLSFTTIGTVAFDFFFFIRTLFKERE